MSVGNQVSNASIDPTNAFYKRMPLKRLVAKTFLYKVAYKETLDKGHGRSFTWTTPGIQPQDAQAIVGGQPVEMSNWTASTITSVLQEYGRAYAAGSFLDLTSINKVEDILLGQATQGGAYSVDAIMRSACPFNGNGSVFNVNQYAANFKTSIGAITSTDVFTLGEVRRLHALLENNNVPTYDGEGSTTGGGKYFIGIDPAMSYDLTNNTTGASSFITEAQQNPAGLKDIKEAFRVEEDGTLPYVGEYGGAVIMKSTLMPIAVGAGSGGINIHQAVAFGDESLAAVDLDGERFKTFRGEPKDGQLWDLIQTIALAIGYKFGMSAQNLSSPPDVNGTNARVLTMGAAISLM